MNDPENRPDPKDLLEAFLASKRSERAFTTLVESLSGLVYSSALRRTRNRQLAEEVTQNVFAILARKAESLRRHPALVAWVMETTKFQAANAIRAERRRQRKYDALRIETETRNPEPTDGMDTHSKWSDALPILDEVIDRLPLKDRQAVLQRFYQGKKYQEIAAGSGQSEAACKMRVSRALEKMSKLLRARGVTLTGTVLASCLGTELARSAPLQAVAAVAPKALAASSSLPTATILANTIQTMSNAKTVTITAAAVVAVALIPFSRQYAKGGRIQSRLDDLQAPAAGVASKSTRGPQTDSGSRSPDVRTAGSLLAAFDRPVGNRALIASLLESSMIQMDPMQRAMLWSRIANMSADEQTRLLADVQTFPVERSIKDMLTGSILKYAPQMTSEEHLERMIALGRYQLMIPNGMKEWAKKDPGAARKWYEEKRTSGKLDPGLNAELHDTVVTELLLGMAASDPDQAFKFFREMPRDEMEDYALARLAGAYGKRMIETGDDSHLQKLLDVSGDEDRKTIVGAAFRQYTDIGRFDEGLSFLDTHNTDPKTRSLAIEKMMPWANDIPAAIEWALSLTPEAEAPAQMRRLAATAATDRHTAEEATLKWLQRQPAGALRDHGYAGIADGKLHGYLYEQAFAAAGKIGDSSLRVARQEAIGTAWLARKPEEAAKGLPAALLEQLQAK